MGRKQAWMLALAAAAIGWIARLPAGATGTPVSRPAELFQIGAGARPLAMGGAFAGLADDENALFYNPAGLVVLHRAGLTSFYSTQYDAMGYGALGWAVRGFGIGALYLNSSDIPGVDEQSQSVGPFGYSNLAGVVAVARRVGSVAVGLRAKYLSVSSATLEQGRLKPVTGSGMAGDLAALVRLGRLKLGVVAENLVGSPIQFSTQREEAWQRRVTAGVSLKLGAILVAADVESVELGRGDPARYYHAGAELGMDTLALRAGVTGPMEAAAEGRAGQDWTAGIGFRVEGFQVDYAYLMPAQLPQTHRLSLTVRF